MSTDNTLTNAKVRIITNSDIRYEGTLYKINANEKTIALKDVSSFGTEERRAERAVPPSFLLYDYIVFRSVEIKDLIVLKNNGEAADSEPKAKPSGEEQQPAKEGEKEKDKERGQEKARRPEAAREDPKASEGADRERDRQREGEAGEAGAKGGRFRFEDMLKNLEKIERGKDDAKEKYRDNKYEENDFFDKISTSVNSSERREIDDFKNKKLSQETFGHVPRHGGSGNYDAERRGPPSRGGNYQGNYQNNNYQNNNYRSGGRGGYRGGYQNNQQDDYRGGNYRGGYQNNQQDNYRGGYNESGRRQGGYNEGGYNEGGRQQGGYNEGGRQQGGYNEGGRQQGGYNNNNGGGYYAPNERGGANGNFKKRPYQRNDEAKFVYVKKED